MAFPSVLLPSAMLPLLASFNETFGRNIVRNQKIFLFEYYALKIFVLPSLAAFKHCILTNEFTDRAKNCTKNQTDFHVLFY